jgi:dTDP-4-dehydrorhamnose 3,5-epimerase
MTVEKVGLGDVALVHTQRFPDHRGWFTESFSERWLSDLGLTQGFVQDNMSWSERSGTLRGLHAQRSPMAQAKLVTVITGAIFDVAVDCAKGSVNYGRSFSVELNADSPVALYVPAGFCHGFLTLKPGTLVAYKVNNFYSREHETGIRWDDPTLHIDWPLHGAKPIVSDKDEELPQFNSFSPL